MNANTTKTLQIPLIENLNKSDFGTFRKQMELYGEKSVADCVNWKDKYPYKPQCTFTVAHSHDSFAVIFSVRGFDLRAWELEDNGSVWEDSCCEFFVSNPESGIYHNFEINCIGTLLGAYGKDRHGRTRISEEQLETVVRFSSTEKKRHDEKDEIFTWETAMIIPKTLFGFEGVTGKLRANFYKCGDKTAHPHFLSWAPIATDSPDFHRPEFFGEISFLK